MKKIIRRIALIAVTAALIITGVVGVFAQDLKALDTPAPKWSVLSTGTVTWSPVKDAVGYNWQLWYGETTLVTSGYVASNPTAKTYSVALGETVKAGLYGFYTVYVQAVADVKSTTVKTGEYGKSDYLSYTTTGYSISATAPQNAVVYTNPTYNAYLSYLWIHNIRCTLDIHKYTGYVGDTKQLNASVNTPYKVNTVWTSSDESVATVDENGLVTLVGAGIAVITVEDSYAGSDTCLITVKKDHFIKLN